MQQKIQIFEPHSKHFEHYGFNGGLLQSLDRLGIKYTFHGVEAHCRVIQDGLALEDFSFRFLRDYRSPYMSKMLSLLRILDFYRYRNTEKMLILSSTTFMNFLLLFFCLFFKTNVHVVLHSEISNQAPGNISKKLSVLFRFRPKNLQFIVNADFIKERMERFNEGFQFLSVLHPVPQPLKRQKVENCGYEFCSVGSYSIGKNSDQILQLKRILGDHVNLGHIGPLISSVYDKEVLSMLFPEPQEKALDVTQFQIMLENVRGILMFPTYDYQYYAVSGVVVDALAHGKIILSTQNQSLGELKKLIPNTLFVFNDIEEMATWIAQNKHCDFDTSQDLHAWRDIVDKSLKSIF